MIHPERLLTPKEVARRFAVDPKTVTRWARQGKLPSIKTPGGHRRYRESVVDQFSLESFENLCEPREPVVIVGDDPEIPEELPEPWETIRVRLVLPKPVAER